VFGTRRGDLRIVPFTPNINDELREGPRHSNHQKNFLREKVRLEVPMDAREMLPRALVVRDEALRRFDRDGLW